MSLDPTLACTAFAEGRKIASGPLGEVARAVLAGPDPAAALIFADDDGRRLELDLTGGPAAALARLAPAAPARGPGRPKLGVVAREVTLLPRHWDWLAARPGGASVALRRLVEEARRDPRERARMAREAAYRVMAALAGDAQDYEEASRALFAGDRDGLASHTRDWPADVRDHVLTLAAPGLGDPS